MPKEESSAIFGYMKEHNGATTGMEFTSIPLEEAITMSRPVFPLELGWPHAQRLIDYRQDGGKVNITDSWMVASDFDADFNIVGESKKPDNSPIHLGSVIQKFI